MPEWNVVKTTPISDPPPAGGQWNVVGQRPTQPDRSFDAYEVEAAQYGAPATPAIERTPEEQQALTSGVSQAARGTLEGGGLVFGGAIGAASGLPAGPGAVVASPAGAVVGGGLGYAAGKQAADLFDEWLGVKTPESVPERFVTAGKDVIIGGGYEAGGRLLPVVAEPIGDYVAKPVGRQVARPFRWMGGVIKRTSSKKVSDRVAETRAAKAIRDKYTTTGGTYDRNIRASEELSKVTGVPFSRGELANDRQALRLQAFVAKQPGEGGRLAEEHVNTAHQKLAQYYKSKFPAGETVDDVLKAVDDIHANLEAAVTGAQVKTREEIVRIGMGDKQAGGEAIIREARKLKTVAYDKAKLLYDKIPNIRVKTEPLYQTAKEISDDLARTGEEPETIIKRILKLTQPAGAKPVMEGFASGAPKAMKFQDIRKWRSLINSEIRQAGSAQRPDLNMIGRLHKIQNALQETTDALAERTDKAGEAYRAATNYYKNVYAPQFKQGTIAKILRPGALGESERVASAKVAGEFFAPGKLDAADDFIRTLGSSGDARNAVRDYARSELHAVLDATTEKAQSAALRRWLSRHRGILKKFDLTDEFSTLSKARQSVDDAVGALDMFNKAAAAKMLGADPGAAISMAFSAGGKNRSAVVAEELLKTVRGDVAAERGLKNAFADYIMKQAETGVPDAFGTKIMDAKALLRLIDDYTPAMKVLYRNEPAKYKALRRIHRVYQTLSRRAPGEGVDIKDKLITPAATMGLPFIMNGFARIAGAKAAVRVFVGYTEEQMLQVLARASFDPAYAKTIQMALKGAPAAEVHRRMSGHLAGLAILKSRQTGLAILKSRQTAPSEPQGVPDDRQ